MNPTLFLAWIRAELLGDPAITQMIGQRIYPDRAPDGTPNPCIVYQLISGEFEGGLEAGPAGRADWLVRVRCYSSTRLSAAALREVVRGLLQGRVREDLTGATLELSDVSGYQDTYEDETGDFGALCYVRGLVSE